MTHATRARRGPDTSRRQDILDAAAEVFLAKGYDATSVQDIADRVGLLKGSLYHYVTSKEDFLFGVIEPVYEAALEEVTPFAHSDEPPLRRLADFVRAHVVFVSEHLAAVKIRLREFSQLGAERQAALHRQGESYNAALQLILSDARSAGDIDRSLDLRLTTQLVVGELNSLAQWYRPDGRHSVRRISRQLAGMIVTSVVSPDAVERYGGLAALRSL